MSNRVTKLDGVHPELVEAILLVHRDMLIEHKQSMIVTDGLRTAAEQAILFAKGRSTIGEPPYTAAKPLGRTVTKADGIPKERGGRGVSNHQAWSDGFGHAVDCCFIVNGKASWDDALPWKEYGEIAKRYGLSWGGDWKDQDKPHVELIRVKEEQPIRS